MYQSGEKGDGGFEVAALDVYGCQKTGGAGDQLVDCFRLWKTPTIITPTHCCYTDSLLSSFTSFNTFNYSLSLRFSCGVFLLKKGSDYWNICCRVDVTLFNYLFLIFTIWVSVVYFVRSSHLALHLPSVRSCLNSSLDRVLCWHFFWHLISSLLFMTGTLSGRTQIIIEI